MTRFGHCLVAINAKRLCKAIALYALVFSVLLSRTTASAAGVEHLSGKTGAETKTSTSGEKHGDLPKGRSKTDLPVYFLFNFVAGCLERLKKVNYKCRLYTGKKCRWYIAYMSKIERRSKRVKKIIA